MVVTVVARSARERRRMRSWLSAIVLLLTVWPAIGWAQAMVGTGFVDRLSFDPTSGRLAASGWAAPEHANVFTGNILIFIDRQQIYRGRFQRSERPDVVTATGRRDWLWSGWQCEVEIPRDIAAGRHSVAIRFVLTDGSRFEAGLSPAAQSIEIPWHAVPSVRSVAVAVAAVLLPLIAFVFGDRLASRLNGRVSAPGTFGIATILSFLLLVAVGVTGSSLRLALDGSAVAQSDAIGWFGKAKEIRSDEWRILTQMAIGQVNHAPPFPVVNTNVGIDGNNMLVVGMTGVPVAHISTLAKPATWGFFLLDLRRALAWHWWFPFYGCFLALWLLLTRLFRIDWRMAAALALTIPAAPYSVGFSGHPAYAVFFPALTILAADFALGSTRTAMASLYGALAGLAIAGFALVLYVPWQIGLGYLLIPFAIAVFTSRRTNSPPGRPQLAALVMAVLVAISLLVAWWLSTREALAIIAETVYPGQRASSVGGDIDPWFLIKGALGPITMYGESPAMDASDAGSFVFLLLPLVLGVLLTWLAARRIDAVAAVIVGFVAWVLIYMYVGFGLTFAQLTLWARATSYRMDLPLGLAQVLLLAWLIADTKTRRPIDANWRVGVAAVAAAATLVYSAGMVGQLPVAVATMLSPAVLLLACVTLGIISYLLVAQRFVVAVGVYVVWMLTTSLPFNPIGQAPTYVTPEPWLKQEIQATTAVGESPRIAIVDEHGWTVTAVAVGFPVVNTVLYYPQSSLWKNLDPTGEQRTLYNRYQHLLFVSGSLPPGVTYRIDSQRMDAVRVTLDPAKFDFRLLAATHVLTSNATAKEMAGNPTLRRLESDDKLALYRVVH